MRVSREIRGERCEDEADRMLWLVHPSRWCMEVGVGAGAGGECPWGVGTTTDRPSSLPGLPAPGGTQCSLAHGHPRHPRHPDVCAAFHFLMPSPAFPDSPGEGTLPGPQSHLPGSATTSLLTVGALPGQNPRASARGAGEKRSHLSLHCNKTLR